jgi:hypothetical protein
MRRYILCLIIGLVSVLSAAVEDLPDVEISGPSVLKSILAKRSLGYTDLRMPDVVDSLKPILPLLPEDYPPPASSRFNFLHLSASQLMDYQFYGISDQIFHTPFTLLAELERNSIDGNWSSSSAQAGALYTYGKSRASWFVKTVRAESPYIYNYQHTSLINMNYNINKIMLSRYKADIYVNAQLHNSKHEYLDNNHVSDRMYLYNKLGLHTNLSSLSLLSLDAAYLDKTPFLSVKLGFLDKSIGESSNLVHAVNVFVSDKRLIPGIHISRRFYMGKEHILHLFQQSGYEIHDNYSLLMNQPWQKQQSDALITFIPIRTHLRYDNLSSKLWGRPLCLTLDLGAQYSLDEPILSLADTLETLPKAEPETVLTNTAELKATYKSSFSSFSQSLRISRSLFTEKDNAVVPYRPLVVLETQYLYSRQPVKAEVAFRQSYLNQDESEQDLRESFELGGMLQYDIDEAFSAFIRLSNILDKAPVLYRTLPLKPAEIEAGINIRF